MATPFVLAPLGALDLDLDLERAATLHAESFAPLGERTWTRTDLAGLLAAPSVTGLLLQAAAQDVGFALCQVAADEAELLTIAVRPAWRRQGAGGCLLTAVIDHVRTAGARKLFLEVGSDNPPARRLYEAAGFMSVGIRRGYYQRGAGPPADGVVMRLTLSS